MSGFSSEQLSEILGRSDSAEDYDGAARDSLAGFDALNREIIDRGPISLACRQGCSLCCWLRVDVFAHEVFLIARHIRRSFAAEAMAGLMERLEAHAAEVLPLTPFEHATRNIRCPLLQEGHCSIYAVRPHSCRRHHSQDLAACQYTFDHPTDHETPAAHDRELFLTLTGAMQDHAEAYAEHGFDLTIYELGTTLREALLDPESWGRWCRREQAFLYASMTVIP